MALLGHNMSSYVSRIVVVRRTVVENKQVSYGYFLPEKKMNKYINKSKGSSTYSNGALLKNTADII